MDWTEFTAREGRRTWFGTLTLAPEYQARLLEEARARWLLENASSSVVPEWWDEPHCDERFRLCRNVLKEWVQLYWKRLRKGGAEFKYFLVFERHKSGLPHIHWLLHETGDPIRLKQLSQAWPFGFTKVKLVKGEDTRKAAYYVSKYLGKNQQSRQIASLRYAKNRPSLTK